MSNNAIIHPRTHVRRELTRHTIERIADQLRGLVELRARFKRLGRRGDAAWCTSQIEQLDQKRRALEETL